MEGMERRTRYRTSRGSADTALSLIKPVGKTGEYSIPGKDLWIEVEILDTRHSWGRTEYLITPVSGSGSVWVASGLTLDN
jgi:hypothetical protein